VPIFDIQPIMDRIQIMSTTNSFYNLSVSLAAEKAEKDAWNMREMQELNELLRETKKKEMLKELKEKEMHRD